MYDRAMTIKALADPNTKPTDLARPGHVNPLRARNRGVLRRAGHTEAAIDLARLAGLQPVGALIEIINEDGTMARLPQLVEIAKQWDMKIISIEDLIAYRLKTDCIVEEGVRAKLPTEWGMFDIIPFRQKSNGLEHIALIKGDISAHKPTLVRMHSSCATGDIFGSLRCECGEQLHKAMEIIEQEAVETQEQLLRLLAERGVKCTQATVSRDIKQLHLVKEPTGQGRYRYAVSVQKSKLNFAEKLRTIFRECVLSVEAAQNLVVLKTIEGMAQGAAFTLDNMGDTDIVGTLAGDDTILLVFHDNVRALDFCEQVKQMLR